MQFSLDPASYKSFRNKFIVRFVFFVLIIMVASLGYSVYNSKNRESMLEVLPFTIPVMLLAMSLALRRVIKGIKKMWFSYVVTFETYTITRTQAGLPDVTINRKDVTGIFMSRQGSVLIKTNHRFRVIHIPRSIENREYLLGVLRDIAPVTSRSSVMMMLFGLVITGLIIGLACLCSLSENPYVVVPSGGLLAILIPWMIFEIRRNPSVDRRTKNTVFFLLLPMIAIIVYMLKSMGYNL